MRCAMMQPTYLPWSGYFNLIASVDKFVLLDDAQFERGTWHQRNRIMLNGKEHWITVPVRREHLGQSIAQSLVDEVLGWREKHARLLQQTYAKYKFGHFIQEVNAVLLDSSLEHLADINIALIRYFCDKLAIKTELYRSSEIGISGKRSEKIRAICLELGCDRYLSPVGAMEYLAEDGFADDTSVQLEFQHYIPGPYPQRRSDVFVSHLSLIDVVANIGWSAASEYIKSGLYLVDGECYEFPRLPA